MGASNKVYISFSCMRVFLLLFNVVFWLCGLLIILTGIWLQTDFKKYLEISTQYSVHAPYLLIALGTIILFVTSLACSCIVKVDSSMLITYGGFLITIMFALFSTSVYIYAYKDQVINGISSGIRHEILIHDTHFKSTNITGIDLIQRTMHCCGNVDHYDWPRKLVPKSCCRNFEKCDITNAKELYKEGCSSKLKDTINTNLSSVGLMTSVLALFPFTGAIFAFALASISNKIEYERII